MFCTCIAGDSKGCYICKPNDFILHKGCWYRKDEKTMPSGFGGSVEKSCGCGVTRPAPTSAPPTRKISQIDEPQAPEYSEPEPEMEEPEGEDEIEKLIRSTQQEPVAVEGEVDYSTLSRKQLDDELNDALDRGDKKALDAISKELQKRNESVMLQIYGEEIQKMLRS
jgi:hypothetical protein